MSIFNEMQSGGYNEVLTRRFALQGASASPALVPEVAAGLIIENDRPEWSYLRGEYRFAARGILGAPGVGNSNAIAIINPVGSGLIVVISRVVATPGSGGISFGVFQSSAAAGVTLNLATTARQLDSRSPATAATSLYTSQAVAPTGTPGVAVAGALDFQEPCILDPGALAIFWTRTTNQTLEGYFAFTERQAAPGELV